MDTTLYGMKDLIYLLLHLLTTLAKMIRAGGDRKPGPSKEVLPDTAGQALNAIVEIKRRNPRYGYPRIAQQINLAFGVLIYSAAIRFC